MRLLLRLWPLPAPLLQCLDTTQDYPVGVHRLCAFFCVSGRSLRLSFIALTQ